MSGRRDLNYTVSVSQPDVCLREPFLRMLDDYDRLDTENGAFYAAARTDFVRYVGGLIDEEQGVNLPEGHVPCSHRWLTRDGEIVAVVRVRHHADTPFVREEVGHIGYDVPPSHRGNRYAIAALQVGLRRAIEIGLNHVLLFADSANPASWRTIETCGGVLENERFSTVYQCTVRRYRITL